MQSPIITLRPTVTGSTSPAYASGDAVGGKLTLTDVVANQTAWAEIVHVAICSDVLSAVPFDVIFFDADPAATTFTDNGALDIAKADLPKVIGVAHCSDVTALSGASIHQTTNLSLVFRAAVGTRIFAAIVIRGAITLAATDDISIQIRIRQDI